MNIYVGNMSFDMTEADLRNAFEAYGTVDSASVIKDKMTGQSKGFGFIEMSNGQAAIDGLNDTEIKGRKITVNVAKPKTDRRDDNRGGGGGGRNRY